MPGQASGPSGVVPSDSISRCRPSPRRTGRSRPTRCSSPPPEPSAYRYIANQYVAPRNSSTTAADLPGRRGRRGCRGAGPPAPAGRWRAGRRRRSRPAASAAPGSPACGSAPGFSGDGGGAGGAGDLGVPAAGGVAAAARGEDRTAADDHHDERGGAAHGETPASQRPVAVGEDRVHRSLAPVRCRSWRRSRPGCSWPLPVVVTHRGYGSGPRKVVAVTPGRRGGGRSRLPQPAVRVRSCRSRRWTRAMTASRAGRSASR